MSALTQHSTTPKKAVIYCRVSSKKQTIDGAGLESQEHRCREYARERGYEVEAVFPDSQSAKGHFLDRPGMKALLAYLDAQQGENYVVIFDDLKRFARDTEFHLNLRRAMKQRNADLECLNFNFEDTPEGRFIETVIAAQGQLEREQIGRQSKQKMMARIEQGFWVFQAPVGYRYVKAKGGGKILEVDPLIGPVVREALSGFASGRFASQTEVKRFLESKPAFPKDMKGGLVRQQTVDRMLQQKVYAGLVGAPSWGINFRRGNHIPLVSFENFQRIQSKLRTRPYAPWREDAKTEFPLRGAVSCACCGSPLTSGWCKGKMKKYPYYWCTKPGCEMKGKTIARDKIEAEFSNLLGQTKPASWFAGLFEALLHKCWEMRREHLERDQKLYQTQIAENETLIEDCVDRMMGATSASVTSAFGKKIEKLESENLNLQEKISLQAAIPKTPEGIIEHSIRFLSDPKRLWESDVYALQRVMLKLLFNGFVPYTRGSGFEHLPFSSTYLLINDLGGKMSDNMGNFSQNCKMVPRR